MTTNHGLPDAEANFEAKCKDITIMLQDILAAAWRRRQVLIDRAANAISTATPLVGEYEAQIKNPYRTVYEIIFGLADEHFKQDLENIGRQYYIMMCHAYKQYESDLTAHELFDAPDTAPAPAQPGQDEEGVY